MATIVTHEQKGGRFAVLGASYSRWRSERGSAFLGDLVPIVTEGEQRLLIVCGADAKIQFGQADVFEVLTIDGSAPADLLASGAPEGSAP
jgi:hypothetical protein